MAFSPSVVLAQFFWLLSALRAAGGQQKRYAHVFAPLADRTLVEESCEAATLVPKRVIKVTRKTALKCMGLHSALTVPLQFPYVKHTVPLPYLGQGKGHPHLLLQSPVW